MSDYICGTCKYYDYCRMSMKIRPSKYDTCDDWTDPAEVEPTEDEKRANAGCDEAHRIMVEGRERL